MAAQRAQILLYRVRMEDAVVRRLQDRAEDSRSKLAQTQHEKQRLIDYLKLNEDSLEKIEDPRCKSFVCRFYALRPGWWGPASQNFLNSGRSLLR